MAPNRVEQVYLRRSLCAGEKQDVLVNITLRHVPSDLLLEFTRKVAANYPGGMSEAVRDLMRRAIEE